MKDNNPPVQTFKIGFHADHEEKCVRLHFPEPIEYVGITPEAARRIAKQLEKTADEVSGKTIQPSE